MEPLVSVTLENNESNATLDSRGNTGNILTQTDLPFKLLHTHCSIFSLSLSHTHVSVEMEDRGCGFCSKVMNVSAIYHTAGLSWPLCVLYGVRDADSVIDGRKTAEGWGTLNCRKQYWEEDCEPQEGKWWRGFRGNIEKSSVFPSGVIFI